jgi:hypothetical protein
MPEIFELKVKTFGLSAQSRGFSHKTFGFAPVRSSQHAQHASPAPCPQTLKPILTSFFQKLYLILSLI